MFKFMKKNNEQSAAAVTELTPEQISAALEKEQKRLHRKAVAKRILKNTLNGVVSAAVGVVVYRIMEDRFGGSADTTDTIPTTPTADISCDDYIAADAATDYTSLEEV